MKFLHLETILLQELHLNGNLVTAAWLESFLVSTPKLTALNFEHCSCVPGDKLTLEWAPPKLRSAIPTLQSIKLPMNTINLATSLMRRPPICSMPCHAFDCTVSCIAICVPYLTIHSTQHPQ